MEEPGWLRSLLGLEPVALAVLLLIAASLLQGFRRGAGRSSRRLFSFVWDGILLVLSVLGAARLAQLLSAPAADWLRRQVVVPERGLGSLEQVWYTFLTSVRDLPLLRIGVLFLLAYAALRLLLSAFTPLAWRGYELLTRPSGLEDDEDEAEREDGEEWKEREERYAEHRRRGRDELYGHDRWSGEDEPYGPYGLDAEEEGPRRRGSRRSSRPPRQSAGGGLASRAAGALLGGLHGIGRALVLLAGLFLYVSLFPSAPLAAGIESSPVYRQAADRLLQPLAGDLLKGGGPVITEAVGSELQQVMQRRYELVDADIPDDIAAAALRITSGADGDRERARRLYDWLGSRIAYDWDKADGYVERGVWKEQTPEDTFRTRKGVCIDTARLYAVMARAVGLEVKVVTGMGADGRGGFGSHAWNEVRLADEDGGWIPLDATWAQSGDWFDSADFDKTHIAKA
ncbi:transglutaminase domain-containing protein [Paenibacillus albicereus]|uniref:Transglutaminase domain-containing protein n=1 Tax=Paenibacillus albicereus TaxID=2726185 RepID=A0A6H2H0X0_9BACL|nr:transglutaminase-like domain-containing protein [Paenibacillus albicereus]QJC53310.1 transglutaminase domain-containing protein [Paenibacillus albicereus]